MQPVAEFHYRLRERVGGLRPGMHRGLLRGDGLDFHRHVSLLERPDPRRFDIDASARDPLGRLLFRSYRQRTASTATVLADVSGSMHFRGRSTRLDMLADFVAALAHSAHHGGDAFGLVGWDEAVREDLLLPPTRRRGVGLELAARLRGLPPPLPAAAARLAGRRGLVFIASDFHFPLPMLEQALPALAGHTVVPLVLVDSAESQVPRGLGLARVRDLESGAERTLWLRRDLARRLAERAAVHREALERTCRRHGCPPLWLVDRFDADAVTAYFYR